MKKLFNLFILVLILVGCKPENTNIITRSAMTDLPQYDLSPVKIMPIEEVADLAISENRVRVINRGR